MGFKLTCENCSHEILLEENYLKENNNIQTRIVGEDLIEIKCLRCESDIVSSFD